MSDCKLVSPLPPPPPSSSSSFLCILLLLFGGILQVRSQCYDWGNDFSYPSNDWASEQGNDNQSPCTCNLPSNIEYGNPSANGGLLMFLNYVDGSQSCYGSGYCTATGGEIAFTGSSGWGTYTITVLGPHDTSNGDAVDAFCMLSLYDPKSNQTIVFVLAYANGYSCGWTNEYGQSWTQEPEIGFNPYNTWSTYQIIWGPSSIQWTVNGNQACYYPYPNVNVPLYPHILLRAAGGFSGPAVSAAAVSSITYECP